MAGIGFNSFNNPYLPKATTLKANVNAPLAKATMNNQPTVAKMSYQGAISAAFNGDFQNGTAITITKKDGTQVRVYVSLTYDKDGNIINVALKDAKGQPVWPD